MTCVSRPLSIVLTVLAMSAPARLAAEEPQARAILGTWRGTSTCTDLKRAPACKDEQVVYTFEAVPGAPPEKVLLHAAKIVNGKVAPMGDLELTYDGATRTWSAEIRTRVHALWSYHLTEDGLAGTLVDLPDRALIRNVAARRAER